MRTGIMAAMVMVLDGAITPGGHSIYIADAIKLLRQEHRWMVRMIERMEHYAAKDVLLRHDILDQLTRRAK